MIGHDRVRAELEHALPSVALLLGPEGVGKRTLANHLVQYHQVPVADVLVSETLSMDQARSISSFMATAPSTGTLKVVSLVLDWASEAAQHALLKGLEEHPPEVRFLLVSSTPVLATVESRARVFHLGLLTMQQTVQVLAQQGLGMAEAVAAARLAPGRPGAALQLAETAEAAREHVERALQAAVAGDVAGLDAVFREWGAAEHLMLECWSAERASGNWLVFSRDYGISRETAVHAVLAWADSRPQIGDRVILDSIAGRRTHGLRDAPHTGRTGPQPA